MNGANTELITSDSNSLIFVGNLREMGRAESYEKASNDAEDQN